MQSFQNFFIEYWDIILMAITSLVVLFILKNVIGKRAGFQQQNAKTAVKTEEQLMLENTIASTEYASKISGYEYKIDVVTEATKIIAIDQTFSIPDFIEKSKLAFTYITNEFAENNLEKIKDILAPHIYTAFKESIEINKQKNIQSFFSLEKVIDAEIEKLKLIEKVAHVQIIFTSLQIHYIKDQSGKIISGTELPQEKTDVWELYRDLSSESPTWILNKTVSG